MEGDQPAGFIGSDSIVSLIEKVRMDDNVRALVFRINSPGGSAGASEEIRRELELVQKEGKPVVVSMGSYATSGGYWISSTANKFSRWKARLLARLEYLWCSVLMRQRFLNLELAVMA